MLQEQLINMKEKNIAFANNRGNRQQQNKYTTNISRRVQKKHIQQQQITVSTTAIQQ